MSESPCDVCRGNGKNWVNEACPYCNGTGEWNAAAAAYLKNHICQCITLDRKFCPVCENKCHHDSSQSPKQRIVPGYDGKSTAMSVPTEDVIPQEEDMILA